MLFEPTMSRHQFLILKQMIDMQAPYNSLHDHTELML